MDTPLVSVLMPAYNAELYIKAAVDSVLNQIYKNWELIVVNDGSSDRTGEILSSYGDRIKVITQDNQGQCAACNRAFLESKGSLVKFFDADDVMSADMLAAQVDCLKGSTEHLALSAWARFYNDSLDTAIQQKLSCFASFEPIEWLVESFADGLNMMQCGIWLIPRDLLNCAGLWDERLSLINDFEFMIRVIVASAGIRFVDGPCLYYRSGVGQSLSGQYSRAACESAFLSTELGIESLLECENSDRTRRIAALCFQSWAYEFFPAYPDLTAQAETRVARYGGSDYPLQGGRLFTLLRVLLGWKVAKRIRSIVHSLGWGYVASIRWKRKLRTGALG